MKQEPSSNKRFRVGIVGVSGYGGGEALRLCATHPNFDLVYVAGEGSAGQSLIERFPGIGELGRLTIQKWDPHAIGELDLLFASLPSGESKDALAKVRPETRIVDIGGDHRYRRRVDLRPCRRLARGDPRKDPHCQSGMLPLRDVGRPCPAARQQAWSIRPDIIVDAKSGVSGAGRGGGSTFGYAEVNEDVSAYGLFKHTHVPEMNKTISRLCATRLHRSRSRPT